MEQESPRQTWQITAAAPNPRWYRLATAQPTAFFNRDLNISTGDGSHRATSNFTLGVDTRINDGSGSAIANSMNTTMKMHNKTAFSLQQGNLTDDPIRGIRFVSSTDSGANGEVHVDILLWQDSGTSVVNSQWSNGKSGDRVDNLVVDPTVFQAPTITTESVQEWDLQGLVGRDGDHSVTRFHNDSGTTSLVTNKMQFILSGNNSLGWTVESSIGLYEPLVISNTSDNFMEFQGNGVNIPNTACVQTDDARSSIDRLTNYRGTVSNTGIVRVNGADQMLNFNLKTPNPIRHNMFNDETQFSIIVNW